MCSSDISGDNILSFTNLYNRKNHPAACFDRLSNHNVKQQLFFQSGLKTEKNGVSYLLITFIIVPIDSYIMNIESASFVRKYTAIAIAFILLGICTISAITLLERSIIYSGKSSAGINLPGGTDFLCELSADTVKAAGMKAFSLQGSNGNTLLEFTPQIIRNGEKKQIALLFKAGAENISCGIHTISFDNPDGKFDFKIFSDSGKVTIQWRERCSIYQSLFCKGDERKIQFPDLRRINVAPECGADVKIIKMPHYPKLLQVMKLFTVIFFAASGFVFAGTAAAAFKKNKPENTSCSMAKKIVSGCILTIIPVTIVYALIPEMPNRLPDISGTILSLNSLNPEPGEQILYLTALISIVLATAAVNLLLRKNDRTSGIFWYGGSCFLLWTGAVYLFWHGEKITQAMTLTQYRTTIVIMLIISLITTAFIRSRKQLKYCSVIPMAVIAYYLWMTIKAYIFTELDAFDAHHYSVVNHQLWQTFYGIPPLETYTTYGGYAFFALPFFKLPGLNSATVDFFWCGLILLTWFFLFRGMSALIKQPLWQYTALAAICGLSMLDGSAVRYVQYLPLRMIFPAALFCLVSCNYRKQSDVLTVSSGTAIASVAVLWNPDSGIVLLIAWILYLICISAGAKGQQRTQILLSSVITFAGIFAAITAVYYASYGIMPNYRSMLLMPFVFGKFGNLQLPMPLCSWWWIAATTYSAILIRTGSKIMQGRLTEKESVILFVALLGCGLFGYYTGRSHLSNLWHVMYPVVILIALAADRLHSKNSALIKTLLTLILIFFAGTGITASACRKSDSAAKEKFSLFFNKLCSDLEKITTQEKRIIYCGPWEAQIAIATGTAPAFAHPALEEMLYKSDIENYSENISRCRGVFLFVNLNYINKMAPDYLKNKIISELQTKVKHIPSGGKLMVLKL